MATVAVKAHANAELTDIRFAGGEEVKERQVIFTRDSRAFDAALKQAGASVKRAGGTQARDIALMKNAQTEAGRAPGATSTVEGAALA